MDCVVRATPVFGNDLCRTQRVNQLTVEDFVPQLAIEAGVPLSGDPCEGVGGNAQWREDNLEWKIDRSLKAFVRADRVGAGHAPWNSRIY